MTPLGRRRFLRDSGLALGGLAFGGGRLLAAASDTAEVNVERGYTKCRYGQLHYLKGSPANGQSIFPPLVLLHQNPSSSVEYKYLVAEMAKDREVIAFDTPGNGMSDWPPEPQNMTGYAFAFADGIANLGLAKNGPVDVFGYHTGTLLAAELAIIAPAKVGRVVMSGIPNRTDEQRVEHLRQIEEGPKLTEDGAQVLNQLHMLWEFVVVRRQPGIPLRRAVEMFTEKAKPLDRYWWPYIGVWTYDFKGRFPLIRQPVVILQPHEPLLEYSRAAAELMATSTFVELPDLERDVFDVGIPTFARELRNYLVAY